MYAMRRVRTRVFPDPAPATTSSGEPAWATAFCCWGLSPSSNGSVVVMAGSLLGLAVMEPLADSEIKRVLVINAHPDDSDFGASGTIAQWIGKGIEVSYVLCTNGDQGGEESGFTKEEMPAVRQREQRAACKALGISDVTFLNYVDGHLEPTIALRKDIVRQIRRVQPDRIVCQSPERNWERIGASHPDHLAAGEATIQAV